jgi:rare lipoprotein A
VFPVRYIALLMEAGACIGDTPPGTRKLRPVERYFERYCERYLGLMQIQRSAPDLGAWRGIAVVSACLVLANCSSSGLSSRVDPKYGVTSSPRVVELGDPVPKGGGTYRVGKPYTVAGQVYVPEENVNYRQDGMASWYGDDFHGRLTANGEVFDMTSLSAAHPTLPMPCYARVTNLSNGKSLIVRVNDRGPYHGNRVMDVSSRAAELLEFKSNGVAHVQVEYVGRAPLEGSDDSLLMATLRTGAPAPPSLVRVASARPFVPEMSGSTRPIRGEVPLPEGRPYNLGSTQPEQAAYGETRERTAYVRSRSSDQFQDQSRAASYESRDRYVTRPVSAYAPMDPQIPSEILAGRGLY